MSYSIIHITIGEEYLTPLVASQLFDQAEEQAVVDGDLAPLEVKVWIIEPFRQLFSSKTRKKLDELRARCPHLTIQLIPGISRMNDFPSGLLMYLSRLFTKGKRVVYHCRGSASVLKVAGLKKLFKRDKILQDIRGFWPAELLQRKGKDIRTYDEGMNNAVYQASVNELRECIHLSDGLSVVNEEMKKLLLENDLHQGRSITVVPCCVSSTTTIGEEEKISLRKELGFNTSDVVVGYVGGVQPYQHLEDMVIPFLRNLMSSDSKIKGLFITNNKERVLELLTDEGVDCTHVKVISLPQHEVKRYVSVLDAGFLLRKNSLVNKVANPVKIAEYLASGVPIIVEDNIGGVTALIKEYNAGVSVNVESAGSKQTGGSDVRKVMDWLGDTDKKERQNNATRLAEDVFLWRSAIIKHRTHYQEMFKM